MKYKVKETVVRKKLYWLVVDEHGRVANDFKHPTKETADIHCRNLNSFFGDDND